jgi:mannitol-1-phosphate 5-dehydrogenase
VLFSFSLKYLKNKYRRFQVKMNVFLGVGLGPIQTGIFLSGAARGGFERIVIAEVDDKLKDAVNSSEGKISINIAGQDKVYQEEIPGLEVYNPQNEEELSSLIEAASVADEIATALPSVDFFKYIAPWLKKGFEISPAKRRFIYTAENNNHAAEILQESIGDGFPNTFYLNTVVGKMSGVVSSDECDASSLAPLCDSAGRGHLVEEFNRIFISSAPGIEERKVQGLYDKPDLYPFEEAKLYGHNAIHFLLGFLGKREGCEYMSDLKERSELMDFARSAFIDESGVALCSKWKGVDELFTPSGFKFYAEDLLVRMTNPFLKDGIDRITRDLPRKLAWDDRSVGAMRVALSQGVTPVKISSGAALAAAELFGNDCDSIRKGFESLWPTPWTDEHKNILDLILKSF